MLAARSPDDTLRGNDMPDAHDELDWMVRTQLEPRGIRDPRAIDVDTRHCLLQPM